MPSAGRNEGKTGGEPTWQWRLPECKNEALGLLVRLSA
jgi:hypothetical protein